MHTNKLTSLVTDTLEDSKATDITVLDVTAMTDITDVMVIATGQSVRQVKALIAQVCKQVKISGCQVLGVEGEDIGEWALIDLGDIIVHIMIGETRAIYNLEKLWRVPGNSKQGLAID